MKIKHCNLCNKNIRYFNKIGLCKKCIDASLFCCKCSNKISFTSFKNNKLCHKCAILESSKIKYRQIFCCSDCGKECTPRKSTEIKRCLACHNKRRGILRRTGEIIDNRKCKNCEIEIDKNTNRNKTGYCIHCGERFGHYKFKRGYFISYKNDKTLRYISSFELRFLESAEKDNNIKSFDTCKKVIPYFFENKNRKYFPDFEVEYVDGKNNIIEIKSAWQLNQDKTKAKTLAARKYCRQNNLTYKILTERQLEGL